MRQKFTETLNFPPTGKSISTCFSFVWKIKKLRALLAATVAQVPVVIPLINPFEAGMDKSMKGISFSDQAFTLRVQIIKALKIEAATVDPPRVPSLVMKGILFCRLNDFLLDSVPTKPTGIPMIKSASS